MSDACREKERMNIIIEKAERFLVDTLARSEIDQALLLVAMIKFSSLPEKSETWFEDVCAAASANFSNADGSIIRRENDDVVVLSAHVTRKGFDQLLERLAPLFGNLREISTLYELPLDAPTLRELCIGKDSIPVVENSLPQTEQSVSLPFLSDLVVKTLSDRRSKRHSPLVQFVEDDPFSRKLMASVLPNESDTLQSGTGQSAIDTYVTNAPDILFLDIGLPDIDGQQVLEHILKLDPQAYVVMLSSRGDRETIVKSIEAGAKGFIGKPFTYQKLLSYIQKSPFIQAKETRGSFPNVKERT